LCRPTRSSLFPYTTLFRSTSWAILLYCSTASGATRPFSPRFFSRNALVCSQRALRLLRSSRILLIIVYLRKFMNLGYKKSRGASSHALQLLQQDIVGDTAILRFAVQVEDGNCRRLCGCVYRGLIVHRQLIFPHTQAI